MPESVSDFINKKSQLETGIENLKNSQITVTSTVNDPNDSDPQFSSQINAQEALDNAIESKREKIRDMKQSLEDMESEAETETTIMAFSTGRNYAGMPIWQCVQ